MKFAKYILAITFACSVFLVGVRAAKASEGTFELESTTGDGSRCFVVSLLMQNNTYQILVSCRNLIYPPQPDIFSYILWARPTDGSNPIRLGPLGLGKAKFSKRPAFNSMFVTTERNRSARNPQGDIVMAGSLQPIEFLEVSPTPTPTPGEQVEETPTESEKDLTPTPEEQQGQPSTREKIITGLKRAGLIALFALIALIGLIFVVTRSRN